MSYLTGEAYQSLVFATVLALLMAGLWWLPGIMRYHGFHASLIAMGTPVNLDYFCE
jgi:hypothetical protein